MSLRLPLLSSLLLLSLPAFAATQKVDLDYRVRFLPDSDQAEVSITLEKGERVRSLDFNLGEHVPVRVEADHLIAFERTT